MSGLAPFYYIVQMEAGDGVNELVMEDGDRTAVGIEFIGRLLLERVFISILLIGDAAEGDDKADGRALDVLLNIEVDMKVVRVVAAVIIDGEKVFVTQRGYGDFKVGWEFLGGKIEDGEIPEELLCVRFVKSLMLRYKWVSRWIRWSMII